MTCSAHATWLLRTDWYRQSKARKLGQSSRGEGALPDLELWVRDSRNIQEVEVDVSRTKLLYCLSATPCSGTRALGPPERLGTRNRRFEYSAGC